VQCLSQSCTYPNDPEAYAKEHGLPPPEAIAASLSAFWDENKVICG